MPQVSAEQLIMLNRENIALREEVDQARRMLPRIKSIAKDHESCECSCGLMILEVFKHAGQ